MKDALSAVTSRLLTAREEKQQAGPGNATRVTDAVWKQICIEVSSEFNVPLDVLTARKAMAYARIRRGRVTAQNLVSPVVDMEPMLMEMILVRQRMKQPMNKNEVLQFANSLISGTVMQENLKLKHLKCGRSDDMVGTLGEAWFKLFMSRHQSECVVASCAVSKPPKQMGNVSKLQDDVRWHVFSVGKAWYCREA